MPADPLSTKQRAERLDRATELIAALILSIAALASSYAGFQSQLWDGEQAAHYAMAEQTRTQASATRTVSVQLESVDAMFFTQWLDAFARGDSELERFYAERFRPDFRDAFQRWIATRPKLNPDAPPSPFAMPGYAERARAEADRLEQRANALFEKGEQANDRGDAFGQATLVLSLSLFIGGIVQAFNAPKLKIALLVVAAISCAIGIARIASLPAIRLV